MVAVVVPPMTEIIVDPSTREVLKLSDSHVGAVTGTVVAVKGQCIPAGYAAGAEWQVMLGEGRAAVGLVGMAQFWAARSIHINQRMMMFEALSCGMFEQKNKYDIRIGDKEGPTVMVSEESKEPWTRLCARRGSAFVYFAPAYDQNNVILADGAAGLQVRRLLRRHVPPAQALHGRRLLPRRHVRRGGHAARRHGHGSRTPSPSRSSASRCSAARRPWTA